MAGLNDSNNTSSSDNAFVEIASGDQTGNIANVTDDNELQVESRPSLEEQVNLNRVIELLDQLVIQMRILNIHMETITDLEDVEEESGDHPL